MQADADALQEISANDPPILRFYEWEKPSATYGYFLEPEDFFIERQIDLAKRPTGGGVLFHTDDLAFSLTIPATHPFYSVNPLHSYQAINQCVIDALKSLGFTLKFTLCCPKTSARGSFCMTNPTTYDILVDGKKLCGAAQRKTKTGLLHQGTICFGLPSKELILATVKNGEAHYEHLKETSCCLDKSIVSTLRRQLVHHFLNIISDHRI